MLWFLLIMFQIKHFLCDYPLQRHGSRKGSMQPREWIGDLVEHAGVHVVGTFCVCVALDWRKALCLAAVDGVLHFGVDRVKAHPRMGGRWKPTHKLFWVALGADQAVHHLFNIAFAWWILGR